MRIVFVILMITGILLTGNVVFADRNSTTIKGYSADTLIKQGDWKIWRITYVASANGGDFAVYDCLTFGAETNSNIKTEGAEATASNGKVYDFSSKPLEGSTGLYLSVTGAKVIVEYE